MKHIEHDIEMSSSQRLRGRVFLKLYACNARIPAGQRIANWYHDVYSRFYDRSVPLIPKYYEVIDMLVDRYVTEGSTVLDLCCGTGNIALAAAQKAGEVIGVDASEGMLSKARNKAERKGMANVEFACGDITQRLGFADGTFDVVTAGFSVPSNIPLFREKNKGVMCDVYRVLKKDGKLVLFEGLHEITDMYLSKEEYDDLLCGVGFDHVEMTSICGVYAVVFANK
jgi:ubiquinone/menaquinone biosynthesis C-methylase UbiE